MKNPLKSKQFYGIIVVLGLSAGVAYKYPIAVIVLITFIGTALLFNYISNQQNRRTVAQMEVLGGYNEQSEIRF